MSRRTRLTSVADADARCKELIPWMNAVGQPQKQVRELLGILAIYRGEIDRLRQSVGEEKKPGFAERIEAKRK